MENKINIAELLKDCPRGMELDCLLFKDAPVYFNRITDSFHYPIEIKVEYPDGSFEKFELSKEGCIYNRIIAKCVIFPKGKTTWEGFQRPFKDGDIVAFDTEKGAQLFIFKEYIHDHWYAKSAKCYMMLDCGGEIDFESGGYYVERLATEEEKSKLFDAINENGYKWNAEIKTLEKLNKNKFDIANLKPFEKVLVRQNIYGRWGIDFFGFYTEGYYYTTGSSIYVQCIPYEGNEHLLGTTENCNEYFKNWE